jgi:hypothetical protein
MAEANRLCLFHIPKTGGTSLRRALVEGLGQEHCFPPETGAARHYNSVRHYRSLPEKQRAQIRLVSGHFMIDDLALLEGFRTCTVLREPAARAVSAVRHFMRHDPNYAECSFAEVLKAIAPTQVQDFYHRRFAAGGTAADTPPSTEAALEGLSRIEFLGFFDALEPFARHVAREVLGLEITLERLNAAPTPYVPDSTDQARIEDMTGRDRKLYDLLRRSRN